MNKIMCCVYDSKAEAFLPPIFSETAATAIRSFVTAVAQEGHNFSLYAEDYTLMKLGEWNELSAEFNLELAPVALLTGLEARAMSAGRDTTSS